MLVSCSVCIFAENFCLLFMSWVLAFIMAHSYKKYFKGFGNNPSIGVILGVSAC